MADEKGVALAILGIVAVIAVVGLVLLFSQARTGAVAGSYGGDWGQVAGETAEKLDARQLQYHTSRGGYPGFPASEGGRVVTNAGEPYMKGPSNEEPLGLRLGSPDPDLSRPQGFKLK